MRKKIVLAIANNRLYKKMMKRTGTAIMLGKQLFYINVVD